MRRLGQSWVLWAVGLSFAPMLSCHVERGGLGPSDASADQPVDLPPTPCTTDPDCNDGLACNGVETCNGTCQPGMPMVCDDGIACTTDTCVEPASCTYAGIDGDGDGYVALGCTTGDDCDDAIGDVHPGAAELCDGIDNDCNAGPDDTFACVQGSGSACTTACATAGTQPCNATCNGFGTCVAAAETCGNACDDDGDGNADDGCPLANDTCAAGTAIAGPFGMQTATFDGATRTDPGTCANGPEIWYRLTLATRRVLYVDTFGSTFDTKISIRAACGATTLLCEDDDCGGSQEQLLQIVTAGTYYIGVHAASPATTAGTITLRWESLNAPIGTATRITGSGIYAGTTPGVGASGATSTCSGVGGREDLLYFTLCPGDSRTLAATTCSTATWDTVLYVRDGTNAQVVCNDDLCNTQSAITATLDGPGIYGLYVDGYLAADNGAYMVLVGGL